MLSLNEVKLAGVIVNNLIIQSTENGKPFCRFVLATESRVRDQSGKPNKVFDHHNCIILGEAANILDQMCEKDTNIYITGQVKYRFVRSTVNDTPIKQQMTEIVLSNFQVVSGGKTNAADTEVLLAEHGIQPAVDDTDLPFP